MKATFFFASLLWLGCAFAAIDLSPKTWHVSPNPDPRSNMAYRLVSWDAVQNIRVGDLAPEKRIPC